LSTPTAINLALVQDEAPTTLATPTHACVGFHTDTDLHQQHTPARHTPCTPR
jgi:hypothetical protein